MSGIVFWSRGIKHELELRNKFLETYMFPITYKVKQKDGTFLEKTTHVQGALRPIVLYEYVIPEPCEDLVLNTLFKSSLDKGKGADERHSKIKAILRKAMGLKKVNLKKRDQTKKLLHPEAFRFITNDLIGIRKDKIGALDGDKGDVIGERL